MANATEAATPAAPTAVKYQLAKLRDNAVKIFGVSTSTFAGATANLPDGEYTIEEIKTVITGWLRKKVK